MALSRSEIEALLPFFVNDTLEGEERAAIETAIANDASLAGEVEALRAIRATMQAEHTEFSPGEMGLARLMRDVKQEPVQKQTAPRGRGWQIAAAILLAVVVGQGAMILNQPGTGNDYELAGGSTADLTVTVVPSATEAQLREALLDAGVEISAGPSAIGVYELSVLEGIDLEQAITVLRDAATVIETVEAVE